MQLVEQVFEFVICDFVRCSSTGCLGSNGYRCSSDRRSYCGIKRAFAVQLIEQRFEFVVSDLVTGRLCTALRYRCGAGAVAASAANLPLPCN